MLSQLESEEPQHVDGDDDQKYEADHVSVSVRVDDDRKLVFDVPTTGMRCDTQTYARCCVCFCTCVCLSMYQNKGNICR